MPYNVTQTAAFVRRAIRRAFPLAKFSVTSTSRASRHTISVCWQDGPSAADVNAVVDEFRAGDYDEASGRMVYRQNPLGYGADFIELQRVG